MTVVSVRPGTETPVGVRPAGPPGPAPLLTINEVVSGEEPAFEIIPDGPGAYKINVTLQQGEEGPPGQKSEVPGPANKLSIGTVTSGEAAATITGSAPNQTLHLTLPQGDPGPANSLKIGTVTSGPAAATITGTAPNQTVNLVLPPGNDGVSPTLSVGDVVTGAPGTDAAVTINETSPHTYELTFTIPAGDRGAPGLGSGDMSKSVYDSDNDGKVNAAVAADQVPWSGVQNKPAFGTAALQDTSAFATAAQGTQAAAALARTGGTMTGPIVLSADGSATMHPITKQQFDNGLLSLGRRGQVRVATTASITISTALNSGDVIDGVTLANGDLVLVKNQSTASQNGVYVVAASPARSTEYDTYDEHAGVTLAVQEGSTQADTLWLCTSNRGGTLGSTAINFAALPVQPYTVNATLTLTGLQLSLNLANPNLWTGKQSFDASTTGGAKFRLVPGVDPSSPQDGDMWTTAAGLYVRSNGVTIGPLGASRESFAAITSANSPYAAVAFRTILCTSGTVTVNLPASPSAGDQVAVFRYGASSVTVGRNGSTIAGVADDLSIDTDKRSATFTYSGTTWTVAGGSLA